MKTASGKLHNGILLTAATLMVCLSLSGTAVEIRAQDSVIKGRVINQHGQGMAGVQVKLVDRQDTMMDVTSSDKEGYYSIDLGALDDAELSKLRGFTLVAKDAAGKISRKPLDNADGQKSRGNKVPYQAIVMR